MFSNSLVVLLAYMSTFDKHHSRTGIYRHSRQDLVHARRKIRCANEPAMQQQLLAVPNICAKGSFRLERSKDRNKVTAVTTTQQRSNALICFTEHTLKRIEKKLCHVTLHKSVNEK